MIEQFAAGEYQAVPDKLFELYNRNFQKAVGQVFKAETTNKAYRDYLYKFEANATKFAACKANYVGQTLWNAYKENPDKFKTNAKSILKAFNRFQVTEYNTMVARCRTARQLVNYQKDADIYPNLEWLRTRSVNPRELHLSFVGLILPINHPFWAENSPGNLYNCKCNWRQSRAEPTEVPDKKVPPAKGLEGNPYKTREAFSEQHPYFTKAKDKEAIDEYISRKIYEKQFEKKEDYFVHPLFESNKQDDYAIIGQIAEALAKQGHKTYALPNITSGNDLYKYLFGIKGAYPKKCPDLLIDGELFEFKSFSGKFKNSKVGNMLTSAVAQADRIIIDLRKSSKPLHDVKDNIITRVASGQNIREVWAWMPEGNIIQIYP